MPYTMDQVAAQQFSSTLYQLAQQKESKFASRVRREPVASAELAYFDTVGPETAPEQASTRHGDTPLDEGDFGRRKVTPFKWHKGRLLDQPDLDRMRHGDMSGVTLQGFASSFGRKKDDLIIAAMYGAAAISKTGASSVASLEAETGQYGIIGTTGGVRTALNTLPSVGTVVGLELAKILLMSQLFNEQDVDPDLAKHWAVTPTDIAYMLDITEIGSADYNTLKVLTTGKVETFMGFDFFWTNRLPKDAATSTGWRTFAFTTDAIILAYIRDLESKISERADKCNSMQIYSAMDLGAVRMEGAKIHECITKV